MPVPVQEVVVFPGQGAYQGDVLADLAQRFPQVRETFAVLDDVAARLGAAPVAATLLEQRPPTIDELVDDAPEVLQLAIYGVSSAMHRALADAGHPGDVLTGHSFGEISALVAGGAYTLAEGAEMVLHRNAVLRETAAPGGAMVALGCDAGQAERLLALVGDPWTVVAVENGPLQTVVSGPGDVLDVVTTMARALRWSATRLKAPYAFHSPLLAPLVAPFAARVAHLTPSPLTTPVYSPTLGRYYRPDDDIPSLVARGFVVRVRFHSALQRLRELGATSFVECGAGHGVTGVVQRCLPTVEAVSGVELLGRPTQERAPVALVSVPAEAPAVAPAADPAPATAGGAVSRADLLAEVAAMYAEALEYPVEVFTETVALEADLGIDSVKQTELLARAGERYGLGQRPEGFRLSDHDTLGKVVDHLWERRSAGPAPTPPVTAPAASIASASSGAPAAADGQVSRADLLAEVAAMYAEALEYPVEVFTETVALEADLGIDSVKQTELLARAGERYGLGQRPEGFRLSDHDTLGKVVDHLWERRNARPAPTPPVTAPAAPVASAPSAAPAAAGGPVSRADLLAEVAAMYAEALEYPVEVFTESVALEADLGIDSVKQTELLARAGERYGLGQRPEGFRLSDHNTLGKVVDHLWHRHSTLSNDTTDLRTAAA
jgi:acyl transferase domain-containing protein